MAKSTKKTKAKPPMTARLKAGFRRWVWRVLFAVAVTVVGAVLLYSVVNPRMTPYMFGQYRQFGFIEREWVDFDDIAPVMARSVVAAEDANYCLHWGLDINAIRTAMEDGAARGGSTISQQVVKNVYLWQGRSWLRKSIEAGLTPLVELFWSKSRILEVYLNVAEFDQGVFGVEAAADHYFGTTAADLTAVQAARLAAVLPSPKTRDAADPTNYLRNRAAQILDGAATIQRDGRADCFTANSG